MNILDKLTPHRSRRLMLERGHGAPAGASVDLLTLSGAGTVTSLWFICDIEAAIVNSQRLQVYVDGEATPSIDVELGILCLTALGASASAMAASTLHMHVEAGGPTLPCFTMLFPIPYSSGAVVKLHNPTGTSAAPGWTWGSVTTIPETSNVRLRGQAVNLAQGVTFDGVTEYSFPTLTGAGWLVYHALVAQATSPLWEERNLNLYVDGETAPSIANSGLEDYFYSSYNFLLGTKYDQPIAMTTICNFSGSPANLCTAVDWLALAGGVRFWSSLGGRLHTEEWNTAHQQTLMKFGSLMLWYQDLEFP